MESESQVREALERQYLLGVKDGFKMAADEFYERGYAAAFDDLAKSEKMKEESDGWWTR
jgi:hypothetical protein